MVANKEEVLQAIKKLANDNGYDFFLGECKIRKDKRGMSTIAVLHQAVQLREGDERPLLNFIVTIDSSRFSVTFDGAKVPKKFDDLSQTLNDIRGWLLSRKNKSL